MNPADCLPVLLLGQPVFRKVHARDHPIPSTVISISGTRFSVALEKKNHSSQVYFGSSDLRVTDASAWAF